MLNLCSFRKRIWYEKKQINQLLIKSAKSMKTLEIVCRRQLLSLKNFRAEVEISKMDSFKKSFFKNNRIAASLQLVQSIWSSPNQKLQRTGTADSFRQISE